jgi:hypothetical protein
MSYLAKKLEYNKIILNTEDGIANPEKTTFTYRGFNSISITKPSYLKIDSVSANIITDAVWTFKLDGVKFNIGNYYNSDQNAIPTILTKSFNGKSSMMIDNVALEIVPQDITEFVLMITDENGNGINTAKMNIEMCIQEIDAEKYQ